MSQEPDRDLPTGITLRHVFDAEHHDLRALAWSPDGTHLLGIAGNSTAWLWDVEHGAVRWRVKQSPGVPSCLAWSPDGRYWVVGSWQGPLQLCGAQAGTPYHTFKGGPSGAAGVGWSSDGDQIHAVSADWQITSWQMYSGNGLRTLKLQTDGGIVRSAAWSPDFRSVAICSATGRVECRDVSDNRLQWAVHWDTGTANCVAWSSDGQLLAAAFEGQQLRVWSAKEAQELWSQQQSFGDPWSDQAAVEPVAHVLTGLPAGASWASFSADGSFLAGRTHDGVLHLWRCDSWATVAVIQSDPGSWTAGALLAFHPRQPLLATVSGAGSVVHVLALDDRELPRTNP